MKTSRFLAVAAASLVFALSAWLLLRDPASPEVRAPAPAPVQSAPAGTSPEPARATHPVERARLQGPARALPGPIEPAALAARADSGDALAACQLAAELSACRESAVLEQEAKPDAQSAPSGRQERCRALLERHGERHFDWLRQAAHAGEPEAMLRYASGEAFGVPGHSFAYLQSPQFDVWRREAPAMLESLLEAGYPEAAVARMMARDPLMGGHLGTLLLPDPAQDLAYQALVILLAGADPDLRALAARMRRQDNPARREARALAQRWHVERFGGIAVDLESNEGGHRMPLMQAGGQACSVPVPEQAP